MSPRKLAARIGPPVALCAGLAAVYLVWAPPSTDLAAQVFRAELFAEHGFLVWADAWYGGFHVPGYSILFPPLAALVGVRVAGALAALAAAGLFAALAARHFDERAALAGSAWFALGAGAWLFTGRLTFLLGVAVGLAAVLAADHRRIAAAAALSALSALASPVAGAFAALAGAAAWIAGRRPEGLALALPAAAAIGLVALAFPTGGEAPFVASSFVAVPLFAAVALWLVPRDRPAIRAGVILYALATLAVFAIPNPLGGNVVRLGALFAGPLAALCLWRRPLALALVALPLFWWQIGPVVRDLDKGLGDPSAERAYHDPLLEELERRVGDAPIRVHVPPTSGRWEAVHVARSQPLARGWLRQLESDDFELFGEGGLTAAAYEAWLIEHAVSYVAVPDAERDYLARDEVELIDAGLPFLRPVWSNEHWRLYRRPGAAPIAAPAGAGEDEPSLRRLGPAAFELAAAAGSHLVRLRWTPHWRIAGGEACARRDDGWTRVEMPEAGVVRLEARFAPAALLGRESVCSG